MSQVHHLWNVSEYVCINTSIGPIEKCNPSCPMVNNSIREIGTEKIKMPDGVFKVVDKTWYDKVYSALARIKPLYVALWHTMR